MGLEFDNNTNATLVPKFYQKRVDIGNNEELFLNLWDTIGQEEFRKLNEIFFLNTDCVVLGYAVTNRYSFDVIKNYWYPRIKELNICNLIYLVGNKIDLFEQREVGTEEAIKYAEPLNLRFYEVSCCTKEGLNKFYNDLVNNILELYISKTQ